MTDPSDERLLDCPFGCPRGAFNGEVRSPEIVMNHIQSDPDAQRTRLHYVRCYVCGAKGPTFIESNWTRKMADERVIELWNRRAVSARQPVPSREAMPEAVKAWCVWFDRSGKSMLIATTIQDNALRSYFQVVYGPHPAAADSTDLRMAAKDRALRFAAGLISTMPGWSDKHPEDALRMILEESAKLAPIAAAEGEKERDNG